MRLGNFTACAGVLIDWQDSHGLIFIEYPSRNDTIYYLAGHSNPRENKETLFRRPEIPGFRGYPPKNRGVSEKDEHFRARRCRQYGYVYSTRRCEALSR